MLHANGFPISSILLPNCNPWCYFKTSRGLYKMYLKATYRNKFWWTGEWPTLLSSGQSSWLQNGDVLFLVSTNWIYICYVEESRPPLWSIGQSSWLQDEDKLCFLRGTNWIYICYVEESGQSSWLQIRRPGFDSLHYQKKKVVGSGPGCIQPREYNWGATG
jgi:hypothetical protein